MGCDDRWERGPETVVICERHGEVSTVLNATHLVKIGWNVYCPHCLEELFKKFKIKPLEQEIVK